MIRELLNSVWVLWFSTSVDLLATDLKLRSRITEIRHYTMVGMRAMLDSGSKMAPGLQRSERNSIWKSAW